MHVRAARLAWQLVVKPAPSRSRLGNTLVLQSRDRKGAGGVDFRHGLLDF
jgi:hypothetical protein